MTREYVLMNRDLPVLRFACERNAFDEPELSAMASSAISSRGGRPPSTASISKSFWSVTAATIWRAFSA